jgi:acetoin utilization deacetylase AcuC-like enzyme
LISAGFDSRENDLLGCFKITDGGFVELTKIVMNIAKKTCGERILSILEGGYNTKGNSQATIQHIKTLSNF